MFLSFFSLQSHTHHRIIMCEVIHVEVISYKCPECGGTLDITEDKRITFCPFCGANIEVTESEEIKKEQINAKSKKDELIINRVFDILHSEAPMISMFAYVLFLVLLAVIAHYPFILAIAAVIIIAIVIYIKRH